MLSQACRIRLVYREPRQEDPGETGQADEPVPIPLWATCGLTKVGFFFLLNLSRFADTYSFEGICNYRIAIYIVLTTKYETQEAKQQEIYI